MFDLSPRGRVYFPDLARDLTARYGFQKYPQTLEEFNLTKGVEFLQGKSGEKIIHKLAIWDRSIIVETRIDTDESMSLLNELLEWASLKYDIAYKPGFIERFAYISDVMFYSDAPILGATDAIRNLMKGTSDAIAEIWGEPIPYVPINFRIGHDPLTRKFGIAPFMIERRADAPFAENKYYSESPLPTSVHWKLLEKFEQDILLEGKAGKA